MQFLRPRRLALMLVSVLLAAALWLLVAGEQTVERNMRIPLEFERVLIQRLQQFLRGLEKEGAKLQSAFVGILAH